PELAHASAAVLHWPMAGDQVIELPGADGVDSLRPGPWKPIVEIWKKADDGIARGHHFFRWRKHLYIPGGMGLSVKCELELAEPILYHVRLVKGQGRKLQWIILHLLLVGCKLTQLVFTPFPFLSRGRARLARSDCID